MHCRSGVASFVKIKYKTCELVDGKSALKNYLLHFLKNTEAHEGCENKIKKQLVKIFFS